MYSVQYLDRELDIVGFYRHCSVVPKWAEKILLVGNGAHAPCPIAGDANAPRRVFTARRSYAMAVLGVVILSVCPPVTRTLKQNQTMHFEYFDNTRKGNQSSFLTPTVVYVRRPFRLKFAL